MESTGQSGRGDGREPKGCFAPVLRIVLYLLALVAALLFVGIAVLPVLFHTGFEPGPEVISEISVLHLAIVWVPLSVVIVLVTLAFVVYIDRRPPETLGFSRRGSWCAEAWLGLGMGFGLPLLMFVISYLAGWSRVTVPVFSEPLGRVVIALAQAMLLMAAVAVGEETVVRGYILQTLKWGYGTVIALLASSILFGAGHFMNPDVAVAGFLGTTAAGLVLGYSYLVTGRLWLPMAFHFASNFALGPVLGFPVSGIPMKGWIAQESVGPPLWTGGEFGPEAGVIGLVAIIIAIPIIRWFAAHIYRAG